MARRGEVSYKVKRAALIAREFTVGELISMTGMRRDSVESVIERLARDGFIEIIDRVAEGTARGRPQARYRVVPNWDQIEQLRQDVNAFEVELENATPRDRAPESIDYREALALLDALDDAKAGVSNVDYQAIKERLDEAREFEKHLGGKLDAVEGYIDFAEGRLELARGDLPRCKALLTHARVALERVGNADAVKVIDALLLTAMLREPREQVVVVRGAFVRSYTSARLLPFAIAFKPSEVTPVRNEAQELLRALRESDERPPWKSRRPGGRQRWNELESPAHRPVIWPERTTQNVVRVYSESVDFVARSLQGEGAGHGLRPQREREPKRLTFLRFHQ